MIGRALSRYPSDGDCDFSVIFMGFLLGPTRGPENCVIIYEIICYAAGWMMTWLLRCCPAASGGVARPQG